MTRLGGLLARPGGVLALIRLAAVPLFLGAERLADHPSENTAPFVPILAVALVYAVAALVAELRGRRLAPPWELAVADLAFISLLVATSGGPFSQLRVAFFLLPIGAGLLLRPGVTALTASVCVACYCAISLTYPGSTAVRADAVGFEATQVLFLAFIGVAATLLSALLTRREREVQELAASRGRLVAQALDAEDSARRKLAEALHDDALQNLLAARQLLGHGDEPRELELVAEGLDRTVVQLREAVFDLHPYLLEHAGLRAALQAVAAQAGRRAGFEAAVTVDDDAEVTHDRLVLSIARELVANAAKHSSAGVLRIAVSRREGGELELMVVDDGRGVEPEAIDAAPARGHIGLASCRERAEAVGGSFAVENGPGGVGTLVRVRLPASRPASAPAVERLRSRDGLDLRAAPGARSAPRSSRALRADPRRRGGRGSDPRR